MTYQPLDWNQQQHYLLKQDKVDIVSLFLNTSMEEVERFTFDRAIVISNYLLNKVKNPVVLDLGASGGVFSYVLKIRLDAHVTAVDDDRYITIQGENQHSSIKSMKKRLDEMNVQGIIPINSSIEEFVKKMPPVPMYDAVLLLNILHHFYTGYGQFSEYGQLSWEETKELLRQIGDITKKYLFFEVNSLVIQDYEYYLTNIMYAGGFSRLEFVGRSSATDGSIRTVWCFVK